MKFTGFFCNHPSGFWHLSPGRLGGGGMKVIIIAASTICGRIGPGLTGSSVDRGFLENMRALTDVSLLGAETLRQGNPEMRGPEGCLPVTRIRGVITQSGDIPVAGKKIFQHGPPPLIFTGEAAAPGLRHRLGNLARVVVLPTDSAGGLSLAAALSHLAELGVSSVLVEGGGRLNYTCLRQGVVDEIFLTLTPKLSGDQGAATFCGGPGPLGSPFLPLSLISCEPVENGELFLKYRVCKGE
jgi:riboflavin biosynthesis pyrimidine reductase